MQIYIYFGEFVVRGHNNISSAFSVFDHPDVPTIDTNNIESDS